jgi:hypothetical protein
MSDSRVSNNSEREVEHFHVPLTLTEEISSDAEKEFK